VLTTTLESKPVYLPTSTPSSGFHQNNPVVVSDAYVDQVHFLAQAKVPEVFETYANPFIQHSTDTAGNFKLRDLKYFCFTHFPYQY